MSYLWRRRLRSPLMKQELKLIRLESVGNFIQFCPIMSNFQITVDNGKLKWFGLDLEDVTKLTKKVIGETDRYKYITGSILDFSWMDRFKDNNPQKTILIAEVLFYYFEEKEVKQQILEIKNKFPGSEMLIEVISPLSITMHKKAHPSISNAAQFKWGINDLKQIEEWSDGIELINQYYFFDRYSNRWGWRRFFKYIPVLRNLYRIGHLRFVSNSR